MSKKRFNKNTNARRNKRKTISNGLVFSGRDWYGTITLGTTDIVASLGIINPLRNTSLFERLSKVAVDFSMFRFRKLIFHFKGTSASTSKGSLAFTAFINDGLGGGPAISNEASVKNTGNAMILRGDGTGKYNVRTSNMWLACDTNAGASSIGNSLGNLYLFTDGTTTAGDLSWDVYIDYVVEFKYPVRPGTID